MNHMCIYIYSSETGVLNGLLRHGIRGRGEAIASALPLRGRRHLAGEDVPEEAEGVVERLVVDVPIQIADLRGVSGRTRCSKGSFGWVRGEDRPGPWQRRSPGRLGRDLVSSDIERL